MKQPIWAGKIVYDTVLSNYIKTNFGVRQGPVDVSDAKARVFESAILSDLKTSDDSDSDEGDSLTKEWETVTQDTISELKWSK